MLYQLPLSPEYAQQTDDELRRRIQAARDRLGRRLVILGHHYQQDDVIAFADFTGDSLKLAQLAAQQKDAEYIVFCGVHFMAESADILTSDRQQVILPDLSAGCSMADMADIDDVEDAWESLTQHAGMPITPVTYVNSAADVKAFVGRQDGACCTSSNARLVLDWALHGATPDGDPRAGHKVLFLPDQHLGRNTAYALGWPLKSMAVFDPAMPNGGLRPDQIRDARILLWKGHCSVHQLFNVEQIRAMRAQPGPYQAIVHPECPWDVCQQADFVGSTEYIIKTVSDAPAGTHWAVGTEVHLVNRLTRMPDKTVRSLAGIQCLCTTMYRIDLKHLCWVLDRIVAGEPVNRITVDDETRRWAVVALDRMLQLNPPQPMSAK
ncbi:MAG: quinolinate synthase NadA [Phycisphaerae bacterium]|jgi:quinolinate synthase